MDIKKEIIKKTVDYVFDKVIGYLELPPEEQQERKELLETKKEAVAKEMMKALRIMAMCIAVGIAIMILAVLTSEPMRALIMSIFEDSRPISEAFYDFMPKLFGVTLLFLAAYATLRLFMWLYGTEKGARATKQAARFFTIACVINIAIALISALTYAFAIGSMMPLVTQLLKLFRPTFGKLLAISIAAYISAIIASIYEYVIFIREMYDEANRLLIKLYVWQLTKNM